MWCGCPNGHPRSFERRSSAGPPPVLPAAPTTYDARQFQPGPPRPPPQPAPLAAATNQWNAALAFSPSEPANLSVCVCVCVLRVVSVYKRPAAPPKSLPPSLSSPQAVHSLTNLTFVFLYITTSTTYDIF